MQPAENDPVCLNIGRLSAFPFSSHIVVLDNMLEITYWLLILFKDEKR